MDTLISGSDGISSRVVNNDCEECDPNDASCGNGSSNEFDNPVKIDVTCRDTLSPYVTLSNNDGHQSNSLCVASPIDGGLSVVDALYEKRYEEGYDMYDSDYVQWLKVNHPEAVTSTPDLDINPNSPHSSSNSSISEFLPPLPICTPSRPKTCKKSGA